MDPESSGHSAWVMRLTPILLAAFSLVGCDLGTNPIPTGDVASISHALGQGVDGSSEVDLSTSEQLLTGTDLTFLGRLIDIEDGYVVRSDGESGDGRGSIDFMYLVFEVDEVIAGEAQTKLIRVDVPVPSGVGVDDLAAALPTEGIETVGHLFSARRFDSTAPEWGYGVPFEEALTLRGDDGAAYAVGDGDPGTDFDAKAGALREEAASLGLTASDVP